MTLLSTNSAGIGVVATFALVGAMKLAFSFLTFLPFAFLATTLALLVLATGLSATIRKRNPAALLSFTFLSTLAASWPDSEVAECSAIHPC